MFRVLSVSFLLLILSSCEPADPEYRRKVWENLNDSGFISHDYFQVVVTVPVPNQEKPLLTLREDCKTRAIRKRDEISINLIIAQITEENKTWIGVGVNSTVPKYEPLPGPIQAVRTKSNSPMGAASIATQVVQTQEEDTGPEEKKEKKKTEIINADYLTYRASFAWLLDRLFLYKEDYSDPKTCTMVFRIVDADLLKRTLETKITQ
ncbi:hypothetical protein [Leptospira sarikeiensis]|uniref:hypothetical protein n=1 Tax=Leptospira sarikeiensis TaxID=2484943 RepID=UPI001AEFF4E6|nr:hypothetical protein [Leptospira sarikeiensis]